MNRRNAVLLIAAVTTAAVLSWLAWIGQRPACAPTAQTYSDLLGRIPASHPGRGQADYPGNPVADIPKSYAMVLAAELNRLRAGALPEGDRALIRTAGQWLLDHCDEDGDGSVLCLNMDVATTLEYYRQIREHSIADLYHFTKDVEYDKVRKELNCLCGSGASDISVREIAEIPEQFGKAEQVVYITGSGMIKSQKAAQDKVIVEGVLPVTLVCIGGESGKLPFRIEKEAVFKTSVDMPGCREGMEPDSRVVLKDLWFDQINSRQIAINAEIAVTGYAFDKQSRDLIQMASVKERQGRDGTEPGIIVYVAKEGDSVWKVAKRYHAPVSWIRSVNDLADHEEIKAGAKVLIVR